VLDGIYAMDRNHEGPSVSTAYTSVQLDAPAARSRSYICVNVPLRQPYLDDLQQEIRERLAHEGWVGRDPNRSLIFSSLGEPLSRSSDWITVSVSRLELASGGVDGVKRLVGHDMHSRANGAQSPGKGQAKLLETQEYDELPTPVPVDGGEN